MKREWNSCGLELVKLPTSFNWWLGDYVRFMCGWLSKIPWLSPRSLPAFAFIPRNSLISPTKDNSVLVKMILCELLLLSVEKQKPSIYVPSVFLPTWEVMSTFKGVSIFICYSWISLEIQTNIFTFHPYFRWSRNKYTFIVNFWDMHANKCIIDRIHVTITKS